MGSLAVSISKKRLKQLISLVQGHTTVQNPGCSFDSHLSDSQPRFLTAGPTQGSGLVYSPMGWKGVDAAGEEVCGAGHARRKVDTTQGQQPLEESRRGGRKTEPELPL